MFSGAAGIGGRRGRQKKQAAAIIRKRMLVTPFFETKTR